jgi:deoxyribodipyrimidine photo-lyase
MRGTDSFTSDVTRSSIRFSFGMQSAAVVLFRQDLRLHDNQVLHQAYHGLKARFVIPVYCFDPRQVDVEYIRGEKQLPTAPMTYVGNFPKCGAFRSR